MAKESELTKKITRAMKAGDKLVQDVKRDVGQIAAAANEVKEVVDDIKSRFKGKDAS